MRVFLSAGEPSGDLHGANLIRQLRAVEPSVECVGFGGPKMAAAGCQLLADLTQLAVMWVLQVLLNLHRFWRLYRQAGRYLDAHPVDAVVLIDYPGFNWWVARLAKRRGIPVFYYGAPQLWAWAGWRVAKMRRLVDHVLCKLPFEATWYRQRGCNATYVGHPYYDELQQQRLDVAFLDQQRRDRRPLVTILPGSRRQEVQHNLQWLLKAAAAIRRRVPRARFAVASFNHVQAEMARQACRAAGIDAQVHVGRTPELMHAASCCMACSGSVSLELLYHTKPTVIVYHINWVGWLAQALLRQVKYITLVNLLATDDIAARSARPVDPDAPDAEPVPFPEYLTCGDPSEPMAAHVVRWLTDPHERGRRVRQLQLLKDRYCQPGASATAARYIVDQLHHARRARPSHRAA